MQKKCLFDISKVLILTTNPKSHFQKCLRQELLPHEDSGFELSIHNIRIN